MSLISIITQTLKSQYPLPAERNNLRELLPPLPPVNAGSVTRGEWWFHAGREENRMREEERRGVRDGREREK